MVKIKFVKPPPPHNSTGNTDPVVILEVDLL